ncbi:hypothetical protein MDA_GLEAN10018005 [Myotis davidii]|uniref:Uncharacterized protein n=1 Tax=Myotis davidii TaxID=225400 RepID=L5LRL5_MYODS|nr:hypothetical protein MDA_GLEAN10018005 [Myotis davidii]
MQDDNASVLDVYLIRRPKHLISSLSWQMAERTVQSSPTYTANGDHRGRRMGHELSGRREVPPLQISQRNLAEPHDTE